MRPGIFIARLQGVGSVVAQSKIIRRTAVTRRDPRTCCGQTGITRPGSASFSLPGLHHGCLFSIHCRCSPFIVRPNCRGAAWNNRFPHGDLLCVVGGNRWPPSRWWNRSWVGSSLASARARWACWAPSKKRN